jgi:lipopolysaccharide transport system permease protein
LETIARTDGGFDLSPGPTPPRELLRDIWRSRQLVRALARKNFYVRYRRATLGFLWAGILPLIQALAISLAFSVILGVRARGGVSYPAFVFTGLLGWNYFSQTLGGASTAIVDSASLASRIYFPRAINVFVQVATALYGFVISVVIMVGVLLIVGEGISPKIVLLVPATILVVWLTASLALVFSALHVYLRDLRYAVVAAMSAWFYITPVAYPYDRIPDHLHMFVLANPATGVVQLFRTATLHTPQQDVALGVLFTCIWATVATVLAMWLHCRNDRNFADLL